VGLAAEIRGSACGQVIESHGIPSHKGDPVAVDECNF